MEPREPDAPPVYEDPWEEAEARRLEAKARADYHKTGDRQKLLKFYEDLEREANAKEDRAEQAKKASKRFHRAQRRLRKK